MSVGGGAETTASTHMAFTKYVVKLQGCQTNCSEKEALEKVIKIERNALPPLLFHRNH